MESMAIHALQMPPGPYADGERRSAALSRDRYARNGEMPSGVIIHGSGSLKEFIPHMGASNGICKLTHAAMKAKLKRILAKLNSIV